MGFMRVAAQNQRKTNSMTAYIPSPTLTISLVAVPAPMCKMPGKNKRMLDTLIACTRLWIATTCKQHGREGRVCHEHVGQTFSFHSLKRLHRRHTVMQRTKPRRRYRAS